MGEIWAWCVHEAGRLGCCAQQDEAAIHYCRNHRVSYVFDPKAEDPYYHYRTVKWIETDIPRANFPHDVRMSLDRYTGTICKISVTTPRVGFGDGHGGMEASRQRQATEVDAAGRKH